MKKCRVCCSLLDSNNWAASLQRRNCAICKSCHLEYGRKWRSENRERANKIAINAYNRNPKAHHLRVDKSRKSVRIETLMQYGGKCAKCGIDDIEVLDLDHIYDDGAEERRKNLFAYNLCRKLKKEGFPKGRYQVLCKNCNWKKELARRRTEKSYT